MNKHPDETMPALKPKPTDTQRLQPIRESEYDPNKTHPNIVVRDFPKGSAQAPERPPIMEEVPLPNVGETVIYQGSLKLFVKEVEKGKGFVGVDGYGIDYFISKDKIKPGDFEVVEADSDSESST